MIKHILHRRRTRKVDVEHEQLTSLINSMADGVIAVDADMHVVIYNGAALNVLDLNNSIHGKPLSSILQLFDKNGQEIPSEQLVKEATTGVSRRDLLLHYSDGSAANVYLSIAPVHLGYGQKGRRGSVLLIRDITHEKSLEEERDEFISVVSHELRTPIAIAEGNISNAQFVLDKTGDITQVKPALQQSHDQIMFLSSMVNDLATLSRAERGKLDVDVTPIDIPAFITELADLYRRDAKKKGLELKTSVAKGTGPLQSSQLYVREVLQNFITNAIKYTDSGSVTISAEPSKNGVLFHVSDTGIGISRGDQEKIFDKFFRSEDYRTRQHNGTGLGLYVTLKLSRLIHAELDVKSRLNHGSTFSIFIPNIRPSDVPVVGLAAS